LDLHCTNFIQCASKYLVACFLIDRHRFTGDGGLLIDLNRFESLIHPIRSPLSPGTISPDTPVQWVK
jgi:hypothetical protein